MYTPEPTEEKPNPRAYKRMYTGVVKAAQTNIGHVRVGRRKNQRVEVQTAVVEWTEAGGGLEAGEKGTCILKPDMYGHIDKKDGWFVHEPDSEAMELAGSLSRLEESIAARKEAEFLFIDPKAEL